MCTGVSGHVEVVKIDFDENAISYDELLDVFFRIHDPTQLNRQGNDTGSQYRSIVLYVNKMQRQKALKKIEELKLKGINVVTKIKPLEKFYKAEEYHQNYFNNNPQNPYCACVIVPEVLKLIENFSEKVL